MRATRSALVVTGLDRITVPQQRARLASRLATEAGPHFSTIVCAAAGDMAQADACLALRGLAAELYERRQRAGAKIVERADDIVGELGLGAGLPTAGSADQARAQVPRDPVALAMEEGEPYDLDALTAVLGMSGPVVLARLLELEIQGIVRRVGGGRFIRLVRTC